MIPSFNATNTSASQLTHPAGLKDLTPCIPALDPDDHLNKPFPLDFYACTPPLL